MGELASPCLALLRTPASSAPLTRTPLPSIGGGCARALAELGLNLALHYSSSRDACEALAADLRQRYPALRVTTHRADMASAEQTGALCAQAAAAHGGQPVLVLVLNAGTGKKIPQIKCVSYRPLSYIRASKETAADVLLRALHAATSRSPTLSTRCRSTCARPSS